MEHEPIELKGREVIEVEDPTPSIQHIAIALDNEEAQIFIKRGYRVFGDDRGPFLILRVGRDSLGPINFPEGSVVDVRFRPVPWNVRDRSGIICFLVDARCCI